MLKEIGTYALVAKVDVSNMEQSVAWYTSKLDLEVDPRFTTIPTWRQLNMPGLERVAVGLNQSAHVGTGGANSTFVVSDINEAVKLLRERGVEVSDPQNVGEGVWLSFFADPDGNNLGLRQNGPNEPQPSEVGWTP